MKRSNFFDFVDHNSVFNFCGIVFTLILILFLLSLLGPFYVVAGLFPFYKSISSYLSKLVAGLKLDRKVVEIKKSIPIRRCYNYYIIEDNREKYTYYKFEIVIFNTLDCFLNNLFYEFIFIYRCLKYLFSLLKKPVLLRIIFLITFSFC